MKKTHYTISAVLVLIITTLFILGDNGGNLTQVSKEQTNESEDLSDIRSTSWYKQVCEDISKQEYNITYSETHGSYQSPNRAQNLRFIYHTDGFTAKPRQTKIPLFEITDRTIKEEDKQYREIEDWTISFKLTGYGRKHNERAFYGQELKVEDNKASIEDEGLIITYHNTEEGMRQDFIVKHRPEGEGSLRIKLALETSLEPRVGTDALMFVDESGEERMKYSGLKVWDREGRELSAQFEKEGEEVIIAVNDDGANYPVTIDPLSTTPNWTGESNQNDANYGFSVSTAGDVNGDGYSDIIVGAWSYDNGEPDEGRAYVYHGSASGLSLVASWIKEPDVAFVYFGGSVSSAGDVNGDGYSDVIIGAPGFDNPEYDEGKAFVYNGSASGLNMTHSWTGESNMSLAYYGWSVSRAGDVNGDGYSDVIVSAVTYSNGEQFEGAAFVYHGSASGLQITHSWFGESNQTQSRYGHVVSTAGDVNGDGYSDIIIGAHWYDNGQTDEGRAYVYHGSPTGVVSTPSWIGESNQDFSYYGYSVSTAGDVNGDGFSDVIVGAYLYDNGQTDEGAAFVYHGSPTGLANSPSWIGESNQINASYGISVSTAGSVNGDIFSDVVIGSFRYDNGQGDEGAVFVYHGSAAGLSSSHSWMSESNQDTSFYGISVSSAGDVNGDGYSDIIIGASFYDNPELNEGMAFVFHGSPSGVTNISNLVGLTPDVFMLEQNYPNPFNPKTTLRFRLDESGYISLKIYNILGEELVRLIDNEYLLAGWSYEREFNAEGFSSGIYIAKLQKGDKSQIIKMMLLK